MEGEKKYSPPFGTTHVGRVSEALWLVGFVPTIERAPAAFWPMMGSNPGDTGLPNIKAGLFAHAKKVSKGLEKRYGRDHLHC